MIIKQHNMQVDGSDLALAIGDRQYAQDKFRDFWHLKEYASKILEDLLNEYANNIIITGCIGSQGAGHTLSWTAGRVKVPHTVKTPTDWSALPPPMTSHTIPVTIDIPAMVNQDISGATTDGVTVNYAKFSYNEVGTSTRQRAKKAGTYDSEINPSYTFTCNSTAPTSNEVAFATFTSDGATLTFTDQENRWNPGIFSKYEEIANDKILKTNKKYIATGENKNLTLPTTASIGDSISVFSEKINKILQNDAENLITYLNAYSTTKGTSGYLQLLNKNFVKLIYKGVGNAIVLPGVKTANPVDLPTGAANSCAFSYDSIYLAVAIATSPYLIIYKRTGNTFVKLADPATMPTGGATGCSFSADGVYLAVSHATTPFITIYKRSGDTFTKLSDPASLPTGNGNGCSISSDGVYLAIICASTTAVIIYKRAGDVFTRLTNPVSQPTSCNGISISSDGVYLAVAHNASPYVTIYKRSGDIFTKLSDPDILPSSTGQGCSFFFDNNYLAVSSSTTPFITIYKRLDGDMFVKLADPLTLPPDFAYDCAFSFDGSYLGVGHYSSPFITIYRNLIDANKTWYIEQLNTLYDEEEKHLLFK